MQHDFILLDRSGSMQDKWLEAMTACNAYVKKLADDDVDTGVTMATFDSEGGKLRFDVIRDRITPKTWRPVSGDDATPRGMTPLNDAVVELVSLANRGGYDKVAIIIMTDGAENDSRENSTEAAKARLEECRAKNWQVIFLGASFNNTRMAVGSYNNDINATLHASAGSYAAHTHSIARKRATYGATGQSMGFSEAEKADLNQPPTHTTTTGKT